MKGINLVYRKADVAIVGAGMAGLTAAYQLQKRGYKVEIFEAASQVGGRIRTDVVEGFTLDRGFQLFYTKYPEIKNFIDCKSLAVNPVYNGTLIRYNGDFNLLSNPSKQFKDVLSTMVANNANWKDKMKMMALFAEARGMNDKKPFEGKAIPAGEFLKAKGFSEKFINSFFKPFLASTFLDNDLQTPSTLLKFILKMFDRGVVGLPEKGMNSIPQQIANKLDKDTIHLNTKVKKVSAAGIQLRKGDYITAEKVLIATNPLSLNHLLPDYDIDLGSKHVSCLYFTMEEPPVSKPIVILNGEDKGLVNNICVVSLVQPAYAPDGNHLIAVNITKEHDFDDEELVDKVLKEMAAWFGINVNTWQHLRTYHIKYALPLESNMASNRYAQQYSDNVFICGDHLSYGSMNAAIKSGKFAAEMIHKSLKVTKKDQQVHRE